MEEKSSLSPPPRAPSIRAALLTFGPVVLAAAAIFILSSLPGHRLILPPYPWMDKLAHAVVYCILGLLLSRALAHTTSFRPLTRILVAVALATAYGVTDELHQAFVPERSSEVLDVAADAVGSLLGSIIFWAGARLTRRAHRQEL